MVESAFEFADICRKHDYHNFVFSMKASNPLVMVQAYRLLAEEQYKRGWDYPLHLGVTGGRLNVVTFVLFCVRLVMVQAYRLLAEEQYKRGWDYSLHLGVTGGAFECCYFCVILRKVGDGAGVPPAG
jgi:4-hydroxy-3-methylbut-2-en-1-yl diphosphate synthase IspG/GcpE